MKDEEVWHIWKHTCESVDYGRLEVQFLRLAGELLQTSFYDKFCLNRIESRRYQLLLIRKRAQTVKARLESNEELQGHANLGAYFNSADKSCRYVYYWYVIFNANMKIKFLIQLFGFSSKNLEHHQDIGHKY